MFSSKKFLSISLLIIATGLSSSCSIVKQHTTPETYRMLTFSDGGAKEARLATEAYSQGRFDEAAKFIDEALAENNQNTQALIVGALLYEQMGRPNKARQFYEDLIVFGGNETTLLGSSTGNPALMTNIAKQRLRLINMKQTKLVIEEKDGAKVFNISEPAANSQRRSAIAEALFLKEKRNAANAITPEAATNDQIKAVEVLFSDSEQNIITRFLILKELAEKDLVTKEEFLNARNTNIGGLLPLTHKAPAYGVEQSVPSPDLIIERINALKEAVESRAITPREFSAERDIIIEALLPPSPRKRIANKAPSRDIMGAAKDLRKLELLEDLQLITPKEKAAEKDAIEKHLGVNRSDNKTQKNISAPTVSKQIPHEAMPVATVETPVLTTPKPEIVENTIEIITSEPTTEAAPVPQPLIPNVTSPF